jgi:type I restriction enzyme, S subunit
MTDWQHLYLEDVCRIEIGKTPARKSPRYWDPDKKSNNVWLSIADIPKHSNAIVHDAKEYISDEGSQLCKIVPKGTLLVSFKLSLGRLAVAGKDLYTNEAIAALYIRDESVLSRDFLHWYLTYFDWDKAAEGDEKIKGKTLNKAKLKMLPVILPPLSEQKRIVEILDEVVGTIDTSIATTQINLKNAQSLFSSYLNNVFNQNEWQDSILGDVCKRVSVGHVGPTSKYYCDSSEGIPFLRSQNVRKGFLSYKGLKYITHDFHQSLKKSQLYSEDVLFVRVGANRGDCCKVPSESGPMNCANIVIAKAPSMDSEFIVLFCQSPVGRNRLLGMTTGSAQGVINTKSVLNLAIPKPSQTEQKRVISNAETVKRKIDNLSVISNRKLSLLAELKHSIMESAFASQLPTSRPDSEASELEVGA